MDDIKSTALAIGAGYVTKTGGEIVLHRIARPLYDSLAKDDYSKSEKKELKKAILDTFEKSELKKQGVTLVDINTKNSKEIIAKQEKDNFTRLSNIYKKHAGKELNPESILGKYAKRKCKKTTNLILQIADGKNGAYHDAEKSILINTNLNPRAGFHEMGHASNHLSKGMSKILFQSRGYAKKYVIPLILATALLKSPKDKNNENNSCLEKADYFVKNNAGKLTFGAMSTILAEEALASIKADKYAKPAVSKEMLKKLRKTNLKHWGTYLIASTVLSTATAFAVKVRDNIGNKKQ